MQAGYGVTVVVRAGQQVGQLDLVEVRLQRGELGGQVVSEAGILFAREQFVENSEVLQVLLKAGVPLDVVVQSGELCSELLSPRRVVPHARLRELALQLGGLSALSIDVKDTPLRWSPGGRDLRCGR